MAGLFCRAGAVFATTVGAVCEGILQSNPYPDIVQDLTPQSSDASIRQAIVALQDEYSKHCPAGSTVAVTRQIPGQPGAFSRIVVSSGDAQVCNSDDPITDDTLFEIGSISKPFTALLLAKSVVEGTLSLETPVNDLLPVHLPDLIRDGQRITLGQLVTHTAGLPREPPQTDLGLNCGFGFGCQDNNDYFLESIRLAAENGLGNDQEGLFSYSNIGFDLLSYALGRVYNTTSTTLQNNMTQQLGLPNTWMGRTVPEDVKKELLAVGYLGPFQAEYLYDDGLCIDGSGSTLSSAKDLIRFLEEIMTANSDSTTAAERTILQQALVQSLTPIHYGSPTSGVAHSWFFSQFGSEEGTIYQHTGATFGFSTIAAFQPKTQTAIHAMSNCRNLIPQTPVSIYSLGFALREKLLVLSNEEEGTLSELLLSPLG